LLLWAQWLAFASSAAIVIGIAPSQILLGLALVALFASRERLRLPPIKLPLGLFLLGTLVAVALSGNAMAGFPQVKKIYVFSQLLVAYTLLRGTRIGNWLVLTWAGLGAASALFGVYQFSVKAYNIYQANEDFYPAYVTARITGFMGHWYIFSVEEMLVLLMLASFVLFSAAARRYVWLWLVLGATLGLGILLAETRAVWIATAIGVTYLVLCWRPWVALAIPVCIAIGLLVAPSTLRERAVSIVQPGSDDSNGFRAILLRTGIRMVEAHPWFGVGPGMQRERFMEYLPPDVPLPLPSGSYMHLHNVYLEYAAERGVPVLLIFLWLIFKILWDFARGVRGLPAGRDDRKSLVHGGIAVTIALLVEGMADVNFGNSEALTMYLVIVAIGYNAISRDGTVVSS
jgi:O-antigen ligase